MDVIAWRDADPEWVRIVTASGREGYVAATTRVEWAESARAAPSSFLGRLFGGMSGAAGASTIGTPPRGGAPGTRQ